MPLKNALTPQEWDVIRDALDQRIKNCTELYHSLKNGNTQIEKKLALTFKDIADKASDLCSKLERMELI